ncbi:hypothetical protein ACM01_13520 [Streptomyces viridochromogenes]|uniref:Secreted protein n=1 Tax=Streptomyces viridochromogenes TaxID=1938 RepID=A0A0J7ZET0_STRVR|nr:DUF6344 domain-containing protein [Streptomyces viridochromogenes]KMS74621.1 hypothetical protein ACM01_13520 [Streptomyces viridochromogenes]KOG13186.1 hypothetical protein ADK35_32935 [Streptomyces viridochromogenes]KOG22937.1 hypothetical protein ADK36_10625 [Streptomyces viridochromogenes]
MTRNTVMKLWTTIVTAFLALFTALGFVSTTSAAAVPHTETSRKSNSDDKDRSAELTVPAMPQWAWSYARALPPTMKQRIRAEAHGKTPSCRHRPLSDTEAAADAATSGSATRECAHAGSSGQPLVPHQR